MSVIYLSSTFSEQERVALVGFIPPPSVLVSIPYLKSFPQSGEWPVWALDSGAFTAWNSGKPISLTAYKAAVDGLSGAAPRDIFALDVIGDAQASLANALQLQSEGYAVVPCYHYGEPTEILDEYKKRFKKVALDGCAGTFSVMTPSRKLKWVEQCFSRLWPKLIHGFGMGGPQLVTRFPFDSTDASNWTTGPQRWGQWASYGRWKKKVSFRKIAGRHLRQEVEFYRRLERESESRFGRILEPIRNQKTKGKNT